MPEFFIFLSGLIIAVGAYAISAAGVCIHRGDAPFCGWSVRRRKVVGVLFQALGVVALLWLILTLILAGG